MEDTVPGCHAPSRSVLATRGGNDRKYWRHTKLKNTTPKLRSAQQLQRHLTQPEEETKTYKCGITIILRVWQKSKGFDDSLRVEKCHAQDQSLLIGWTAWLLRLLTCRHVPRLCNKKENKKCNFNGRHTHITERTTTVVVRVCIRCKCVCGGGHLQTEFCTYSVASETFMSCRQCAKKNPHATGCKQFS